MQTLVCKQGFTYASDYYGLGPTYYCPNDDLAMTFDADAFDVTEYGIPVITVGEAKTIGTAIAVLFALAFVWRKLRDVV